jgi:hypothetical protein
MKGRRRLVIDASVGHAAGAADATHPVAKSCRDFLQAVLSICHGAVFGGQLHEEWKTHASGFAQSWQVAMERRRKLDWIDPPRDEQLREAIVESAASEKEKKAMEKDVFLLEVALATADRMVASRDDAARALFWALAVSYPPIRKVIWINPASADDDALAWLRSGAKPEHRWRLGHGGEAHP